MMEVSLVEEKKNKIIFEIEGATHTFCNLLKEELHNDDSVKIATYSIEHPLIGTPKFILETSGDAKKTLSDACKRMGKLSEKFMSEFKKEVK